MPDPSSPLALRIRNLTLLLGSTMTVMAGATIAPAIPQIKDHFHSVQNVDLLVKMVLTIPALFIAFGSLFAGVLLDRWGRKPVLAWAMVLYGLAGTSGFILESLEHILWGRALLGIAVAGIMTGCTTLIADYFDGQEMRRFMGLQASFMGFGGVLFLLGGGFLADLGWRFPFLIYLFAFAILPGALFFVKEPTIHQHQRIDEEADTPEDSPFPFLPLMLVCALAFVGMVVFYMIPVQFPLYMQSIESVPDSRVGIALASLTLSVALTASQYQKIKARLSFSAIFTVSFLLNGVAYYLIGNIGTYAHSFTGLILAGIGLGMMMPNLNVLLVSFTSPAFRGRAVGSMNTFLFLGQFFSPIVLQPIVEYADMAFAFQLVGVFVGSAGLVGIGITLRNGVAAHS